MAAIMAIRHAPYLQNSGRDPELSPEGKRGANELAQKLGEFDLTFCSEYLRARQTASLFSLDEFVVDPYLNELTCPLELKTDAEHYEHLFRYHLEEVRAKAVILEKKILSLPQNSKILFVSHGITLMALYVQARRGMIEPGDWSLTEEFEPLSGFKIWTADGRIFSTLLFEP